MATPLAVLFDLDDTLFDHTYSCRMGLVALRNRYRFLQRLQLDTLEYLHHNLLEQYHSKVLTGQLALAEARVARFRVLFSFYGQALALEEAIVVIEQFRAVYRAHRRVVPGAIELLIALRALQPQVKIGIVTNNMTSEQEEKVAALHLHDYYDALIVSDAVGVAKPHPRIFEAALKQLGVRANQAVMVGDSWDNDIVGAQAAGIRPVWLNRRAAPCPDIAVAFIPALEPLEEILALLLNPTPASRQPVTATQPDYAHIAIGN